MAHLGLGVRASNRSAIESEILRFASRPSRRLLVSGEPGIGKTTLLNRAAAQLAERGFVVLSAHPAYAERKIPYSTLWDLLADLRWEENLELRSEYRLFLRVALGEQPVQTALPPLAVSVALEELLATTASKAPVVIIVDDSQWADAESLTVLDRALRRSGSSAVYFLAASRTHVSALGTLVDFDEADVYTLAGLSAEELEDVAKSAWPTTLTSAQLIALREHTAGNPMWALELIARGDIANLGAIPVGTLKPPASLIDSVSARLSTLSDAARDVVRVVALTGRTPPEVLISVLGEALGDIAALEAAVGEAENAGLISVTTEFLRVVHPLHASAAVSGLAADKRRRLHRAIADAVDSPEAKAQHLQQSEPPGTNEEVAGALLRASALTSSKGAPMRAAHFAAQAVQRTDPASHEYPYRLLEQGRRLVSAGDYVAAMSSLELIDPPSLDCARFDVYIALMATTLTVARGNEEFKSFFDAQIGELQNAPQRLAIVTAVYAEDDAFPVEERIRLATKALANLKSEVAPNAVRRAMGVLIRGRVGLGLGFSKSLLAEIEYAESVQMPHGLHETGLAQVGLYSRDLDDVEGSRQRLAELTSRAVTAGEEGVARIFAVHAAATELLDGRTSAGGALLEGAGFEAEQQDLPSSALAAIGTLLIATAKWDELARMLAVQESSRLASPGEKNFYLTALRGLAASAREEWETAVTQLRSAAQMADESGLVELGQRFRIDLPLVEALFRSGEADEASRRLADVRAFLAEHDRPISRLGLHRMTALELAEGGDLAGALAEIDVAVDLARAAGREFDEAAALLQRGRLLKRQRRSAAARDDLSRARELAESIGNIAIAEAITRTERTLRKGRSASTLTPAEEVVLEQVRTGATNKEISAALFISVRTVESHVASIVRKTGISSRLKLIVQ